jgi:protoporphyrinogen oxidase
MEYFCGEGDEIWSGSDAELSDLASRELAALGLAAREDVIDSLVLRQKEAYPVYDIGYRGALQVVRRFVGSFENLQTIGRGGMHRYNNQDHSMLTGILAARNLLGESHDLWEVNGDESYHEAGR